MRTTLSALILFTMFLSSVSAVEAADIQLSFAKPQIGRLKVGVKPATVATVSFGMKKEKIASTLWIFVHAKSRIHNEDRYLDISQDTFPSVQLRNTKTKETLTIPTREAAGPQVDHVIPSVFQWYALNNASIKNGETWEVILTAPSKRHYDQIRVEMCAASAEEIQRSGACHDASQPSIFQDDETDWGYLGGRWQSVGRRS